MRSETVRRSIVKAVSWRAFGSAATAALVFLFTRRAALSLGIGLLESLSKIILYFVHERCWNRIGFGKHELRPAVLWFTGLPSSGKSTLAEGVSRVLGQRGFRVEHLDGDAIRAIFPETGFSPQERDSHIRRVGHLASVLERNGVLVVVSLVSPYAESRRLVRRTCRSFVEVYVSTPLEVCERRDAKGLYARARRGEILDFTGVDAPYEAPERPELTIDTSALSPSEGLARIMDYVDKNFSTAAP